MKRLKYEINVKTGSQEIYKIVFMVVIVAKFS